MSERTPPRGQPAAADVDGATGMAGDDIPVPRTDGGVDADPAESRRERESDPVDAGTTRGGAGGGPEPPPVV